MAMNPNTRSKLDFPTPRSRQAPKTFSGRYDEVDSFLQEFDALSSAYGLTNDEKFQKITLYVTRSIREVIEGLQEYTDRNWTQFSDTLRRLYDHVKTDRRFKEKDLRNLVSDSKKKRIHSLYDFNRYQRKFTRIGGWLLQKNKILDDEYNKYFWQGIHHSTRRSIESRMLQVNPNLNRGTPYPITIIVAAAQHVFDVSVFYEDTDDSDSSSEDSEYDSNSDEESSDTDSDSDEENTKKNKRSTRKDKIKPSSHKTKVKAKSREQKTTQPPSKPVSKDETNEVAELIDQLNRLSINDQGYASLYYRITIKDPSTINILTKPPLRRNDNPARTISSSMNSNQQASNGPYECFFCGEKGHGLRRCQQADAMIKAGTIIRNNEGRITWPDGTSILRNGDETILSAINRELAFRNKVKIDRPPTTNIIYETFDLKYPDDPSTEEEDFDDEEPQGSAAVVMPVHRTKDTRKEGKKNTFDGVYPPLRRTPPAGPMKSDAIPTILKRPSEPTRPEVIRSGEIDEENDDVIMEDVTPENKDAEEKAKLKRKKSPTERNDKPSKVQKPTQEPPSSVSAPSKLQSQCTRDTDMDEVFQKLCKTPVTISLQEVFGSSPTMAKKMQDYLRLTRSQKSAEGQVNEIGRPMPMFNPPKSQLIMLPMKFNNGLSVNALIDPGSELDIIHRTACIKARLPIDTNETTYMRDAGQHDTKMDGICRKVKLRTEGLATFTNLWVGDNLPFGLLLGRPWQRQNRISIEERESGTWLSRRDMFDRRQWETCVQHAEEYSENTWDFFGVDQRHHPPPPEVFLAQTTSKNPDQEDDSKT
jgi:hypothetical protein